MYVLREAPSGTYDIKAKYFSTNRLRAGTRTKVYATIYRNWGTDRETVTRRTVTLRKREEMTSILEVQMP